jgi:hypothetical protein
MQASASSGVERSANAFTGRKARLAGSGRLERLCGLNLFGGLRFARVTLGCALVRRGIICLLAVAAAVGIARPATLDQALSSWEHLAAYVGAQR